MHRQYWVYETKIKKKIISFCKWYVYECWAKTQNGKQNNNCLIKLSIGVQSCKRWHCNILNKERWIRLSETTT